MKIKQSLTLFIQNQSRNNYQWKQHLWCISSIYAKVISSIQKFLGGSSGWIIDSIFDHNISISKYNSLAWRIYIKLPKELNHLRKGLINIQNIDDNGCFKWWIVWYLHSVDHNPKRFTKADKEIAKKLDFKDIKFPVKVADFLKIEKKNFMLVFFFIKIPKPSNIYMNKMLQIVVNKSMLIYC